MRPIIECAGAGKPLAAFFAPEAPEALAMLGRAGVPNFHTPEACADAIAAALSRRAPRPQVVGSSWPGLSAASGRMLDELEAGTLIDRLGISRAPAIALDADIAAAPALPFAYPVAVKVLSAEIAHKTDLGGVVLGVTDGEGLLDRHPTDLRNRGQAPARRARHPRAGAADGRRRRRGPDRLPRRPRRGAAGDGGDRRRHDRDRARPQPAARSGRRPHRPRDAGRVARLAAASGYRGRPAGDLGALAQAVAALSRLADDPTVVEAEINPLIVRPAGDGVVAVDALVKLVETP